QVKPTAQTTNQTGLTGTAIWIHPTDVTLSRVLTAQDNGGIGGVATFTLAGMVAQPISLSAQTEAVDVRYGIVINSVRTDVAVSVLQTTYRLWAASPVDGTLSLADNNVAPVTGLVGVSAGALYRNPRTLTLS